MRSPRRFVPSALVRLEGRIVLSHVAPTPPPPDAETTALLAGQTVTDHYTTTSYTGLMTTDNVSTVMISPNTNRVTSVETLAEDQGTVTTVEIETYSKTGVTRQYSTVEANGQVQTESRTDTDIKNGSAFSGAIDRPDGVVITFTGKTIKQGSKSTTTESFKESNGVTYKEHNITTTDPGLTTHTIAKTTWGDGSVQINHSTTTDVRTL